MYDKTFDEFFTPAILWGYSVRTHRAHLMKNIDHHETVDYRQLVHPDDLSGVQNLIRDNARDHRRRIQPSRRLVASLHRVMDSKGAYHPHLSLIVLIRDSGLTNRLLFLSGIDLRISEKVPLNLIQMRNVSRFLKSACETLSPIFQYLMWYLNRCLPDTSQTIQPDPYFEKWRCGDFIISPSEREMKNISDSSTIPLSEKQSRFIALLLSAKNSDGEGAIVERAKSSQALYGPHWEQIDPMLLNNSIDRNVMFFRKLLCKNAIRTVPRSGHILKMKRYICENEKTELPYSGSSTIDGHNEVAENFSFKK